MSRVTTTLEEILDVLPCVLFDTSVSNHQGIKLLAHSYDKFLFSSLDKNVILEEISSLDDLRKITSSQNTFTTEEVINEFWKYVCYIGEKIAFLSHSEKIFSKPTSYNHGLRRRNKVYSKCLENRKLLSQLQSESYNLFLRCKERVLKIEDKRYPLLIEMIQLIDKSKELKRDTSYKYGMRNAPNTSSDTDEKLLAALYLQILNNEEDVVILTQDTDFYRLTGACSKLLGSSIFLPYNEQFREMIRKFPPLIAKPYNEGYEADIFDDIYFKDNFIINGIPSQINESVKQKIFDLWKKFSESENYSYLLSSNSFQNLSLSHPN